MGLGLLPGEQREAQGSGGLFWGYRGKGTGGLLWEQRDGSGPSPRLCSGDRYRSSPAAVGRGSPPAAILRASAAPRPAPPSPPRLIGWPQPRPASPRAVSLAGRTSLCRSLAAGAARHGNTVTALPAHCRPPASRCHWLPGEARPPAPRRHWLLRLSVIPGKGEGPHCLWQAPPFPCSSSRCVPRGV